MLNNKRGAALIFTLLAMLVLLALGLAILNTGSTEAWIARNQLRSLQAFYAAEAGIEESLAKLKKDQSLPDPDTEVILGSVSPGNVQAKYKVNLIYPNPGEPASDKTIRLESTGIVENSRYKLVIQGKYKKGGQYLDYAMTDFSTEPGVKSYFHNNVTVSGNYLINHDYEAGNDVEFIDGIIFTDTNVGFPEMPLEWYNPAGYEPYVISHYVDGPEDLVPGHKYYYLTGGFDLKEDLHLDGVIIKSRDAINFNNDLSISGVTFVTDQSISLTNRIILTDVTLVGSYITLNNKIEATRVVIVDKHDSTLNNEISFTGVIITKGTLYLNNNVDVSGSIICGSINANNDIYIDLDEDINEELELLPPGIEETSVLLESWGESGE